MVKLSPMKKGCSPLLIRGRSYVTYQRSMPTKGPRTCWEQEDSRGPRSSSGCRRRRAASARRARPSCSTWHSPPPPPPEEPETNGAATVKQSKLELERVLDIYEQRLEEAAYLAGDKFSLADLSHLPNAHRLVASAPECASMFESRRRVSRWWEAISGRASWREVAEMQKERESPPPAAAEGAPGIMCSG